MIVYLDANPIPPEDIMKFPEFESELNSNGRVIASGGDLVLNNASNNYSDMSEASQFFGADWYNKIVEIYDPENDVFLFVGKIKNIIIDEGARTVTVKFINYIYELSETTLIYTASAQTPADIIKDILLYAGVPESFIDNNSFVQASSVQTSNSILFNVNYAAKDNINCINVVSELCKIAQCELYTVNNIIKIYQNKVYSGEVGYPVQTEDLIAGTFKSEYIDDVFNAYSIGYNSAGTLAFSTGQTAGTEGNKIFSIPDRTTATTTADIKLILSNASGATYLGGLLLSRLQYQTKIVNFEVRELLNYLKVSDIINLTYKDYKNEPMIITKIKYNTQDRKFGITAECLNLPVNVITRDQTPPDSTIIEAVLPYPTGALIKFADVVSADLKGFEKAFATTLGMWEQDYSNLGRSPIDVVNPAMTPDGFLYSRLFELRNKTIYYFKLRSVDTNNNKSEWSDVRHTKLDVFGTENYYKCKGDPYTGIIIDQLNSKNGTPLTAVYGDFLYGEELYSGAGFYQSYIYKAEQIVLRADGDVFLSFRMSADNDTRTDWTDPVLSNPIEIINNSLSYLQIRFYLVPELWSDDSAVYITSII
jgi:hypothetical protein